MLLELVGLLFPYVWSIFEQASATKDAQFSVSRVTWSPDGTFCGIFYSDTLIENVSVICMLYEIVFLMFHRSCILEAFNTFICLCWK